MVSALRGMGNDTIFADEIVGFHIQQAIEKLFKAWLALAGRLYPPTHDLNELLALLKPCQPDAAGFVELTDYTPCAVQFRYTGADAAAGPLDRDAALNQVEILLKRVGDNRRKRRRADDGRDNRQGSGARDAAGPRVQRHWRGGRTDAGGDGADVSP